MSTLVGRQAARAAAPSTSLAWIAPSAVAAVSSIVLVQQSRLGDYVVDAGPALQALVAGHVGRAIAHQPLMGSFAVVARLPFAAAASLAGAGDTGIYRAGVLACALALAAVGVTLARVADQRPWALALPFLAILNPAALAAVRSGHPEEALAAALLVGAALCASRSAITAGLLLGLALATKQWAVVGVGPVLWLVPSGRRRVATCVAGAIALALTLPLLVSSSAFTATSHQAATSPTTSGRATLWFLVAHHTTLHLNVPAGIPSTVSLATVPSWIARGAHPAIVLLPLVATALVWRRKPTTADALTLLTLVLLARCVLDPVDNAYYHLPFVVALLALEVVRRRPPVATLAACAGLWLTFDRLDATASVSPFVTNGCYLAWTTAIAAYLAHFLWSQSDRART